MEPLCHHDPYVRIAPLQLGPWLTFQPLMVLDRKKITREDGYYVVRLIIKRTTTELQPVTFGYNLCSTVVVE